MAGRRPALEVAYQRNDGEVLIDHAALSESDLEWLHDVEHLRLWNVTTPPGFLARLPRLWLLDIRGGSGSDLSPVDGCTSLRGLMVSHVRGLHDLSVVAELVDLEYLELYGLKQVTAAPSLRAHSKLRHIMVGRMTGLRDLGGLLDAPALEDLQVIGKVAVTADDVARIRSLDSLQTFDWNSNGQVPVKQWVPVLEMIALPTASPCFPREWFRRREP